MSGRRPVLCRFDGGHRTFPKLYLYICLIVCFRRGRKYCIIIIQKYLKKEKKI